MARSRGRSRRSSATPNLGESERLALFVFGEALQRLSDHRTGDPHEVLKLALGSLPTWALYQIVQVSGRDPEISVGMGTNIALLFFREYFPLKTVDPAFVVLYVLIIILYSVGLLESRVKAFGGNVPVEIQFKDVSGYLQAMDRESDEVIFPPIVTEIRDHYAESDPSLRNPSEFDLVRFKMTQNSKVNSLLGKGG